MFKTFFATRIITALGLLAVWGNSGLSPMVMLIPFVTIAAWFIWCDFRLSKCSVSRETGIVRMVLDAVIFILAYFVLIEPLLAAAGAFFAIAGFMWLYVWWHKPELGWVIYDHPEHGKCFEYKQPKGRKGGSERNITST